MCSLIVCSISLYCYVRIKRVYYYYYYWKIMYKIKLILPVLAIRGTFSCHVTKHIPIRMGKIHFLYLYNFALKHSFALRQVYVCPCTHLLKIE